MEKTNEKRSMGPLKGNVYYFIKWTVISGLIGLIVGFFGAVFGHGVVWATRLWNQCSWTLFLMPFAGLFIVWLYQVSREGNNRGTNMVLDSISSNEEVSLATAPLIFVSTLLSHAVSASVGREGAALQLGGSLGNLAGKLFRLDEKDRKIAIMCGMSACFSALFGTPLAAGIFSLEVVSVGVMYYAALLPCLFASFIGAGVAAAMGLEGDQFLLSSIPAFNPSGAGIAVLLGIICAGMGIFLCVCLHKSGHLYQKYLPNPYHRVLAGSLLFIVLVFAAGDRSYNGSGMALIERCFEGEAVAAWAFLAKILFTCVALGAGFKGGEIVPSLCVGACFGSLAASVFGFPNELCTAVGMACLFVSVTNCPISTIFLAFEMFGFEAMPYFVIAVAVCFALSGYYSLYSSQKFAYSKTRTEYINRKSH